MEWTETLRQSVAYMEKHLLEDISAETAAHELAISSFYLQKGFRVMTGYSMGEYIRCRRLYLAALDILTGRERIIDIAYKYGYEVPESFTKAFTRFHGVSPVFLRQNPEKIKTFLPLKIHIMIQGGSEMDYTVEKLSGFRVIGFIREFHMDSSYGEIPQYWDEFYQKYCAPLMAGREPETELEQAICENNIGAYGVCLDDIGEDGRFHYMIAGEYRGGTVPQEMSLYDFPDMEWAKFRCTGQMPAALQTINTKIFQEWLPGNAEYEIAMGANIEWYSKGNMDAPDYESAIWIPVKRK